MTIEINHDVLIHKGSVVQMHQVMFVRKVLVKSASGHMRFVQYHLYGNVIERFFLKKRKGCGRDYFFRIHCFWYIKIQICMKTYIITCLIIPFLFTIYNRRDSKKEDDDNDKD